MMTRDRVLAALSALASETRLDLVRLLVVAGDAGLPAGVIAERLGVSASRLSFHLSALEQARLVTAARDGRRILYRADHAGIGGIIGYLLHDCCGGHPEVSACTDRAAIGAAVKRHACQPVHSPGSGTAKI